MTDGYTLQSVTQTGYEVHTPIFEGPLALLLRLIEKNELDITKVALAQVTDEFLEQVDRMRTESQIDAIAEFLAVAAKLLWIKSKALLPKPPASAREVDDEDDIGDELIRQLRAYRQYKEAAAWLRERDHAALRSYVRGGYQPRPTRITLDLAGIDLQMLRDAAELALIPTEPPRPERAIQRVRISIVEQVALIQRRLMRWARLSFRKLLSDKPTRLEAIVTLQALLELMKQQAVAAQQEEPFGDITIQATIPPEQISLTGMEQETPAAATS
ncbi:MAG: segregation/condensation protein A [Anaerolineae bacterium]|jgi:segregation and condensation protein A|nr:segregation/condensation protein A [Anaerolineae bacterium]